MATPMTWTIRMGCASVRRSAVVQVMGAVALACAMVIGSACYSPTVSPGLLKCAPLPAKQCPDGFSCANGVCVTEGGRTGGAGAVGGRGGNGGGGGMVGTGGAGGTCASPITPLCQANPVAPAVCDTVCQTGCGCGLRCSVTTAGVGCASPIGARLTGELCDPNADQCAPGFVCLQEACGTNLGRCYRYCRDASVCGASGVCGTPVDLPNGGTSGQKACNMGDYSCDAFLRTGCSDPAFNCYVTGPGHTTCDCPRMNLQEGDTCANYNDCAPGLACLQVGGATRCFRVCRNTTDCAGCMPLGTAGGFCP